MIAAKPPIVGASGRGHRACDFVAEAKRERQIRAGMVELLRVAHPELVSRIDYEQVEELKARIRPSTLPVEQPD